MADHTFNIDDQGNITHSVNGTGPTPATTGQTVHFNFTTSYNKVWIGSVNGSQLAEDGTLFDSAYYELSPTNLYTIKDTANGRQYYFSSVALPQPAPPEPVEPKPATSGQINVGSNQ